MCAIACRCVLCRNTGGTFSTTLFHYSHTCQKVFPHEPFPPLTFTLKTGNWLHAQRRNQAPKAVACAVLSERHKT